MRTILCTRSTGCKAPKRAVTEASARTLTAHCRFWETELVDLPEQLQVGGVEHTSVTLDGFGAHIATAGDPDGEPVGPPRSSDVFELREHLVEQR